MNRVCEICGGGFTTKPSIVRRGGGRFCSYRCTGQARSHAFAGHGHPNWRGGKKLDSNGYVRVCVPDHPLLRGMRVVGQGNTVLEHRLVMAESLGGPLRANESVHHRNGIKTDNRLENLELRVGQHGKGAALCCGDCGSRNLVAWTYTLG